MRPAISTHLPFSCRCHPKVGLWRSHWRGSTWSASCFVLAFGLAVAAASGPASAEGGQKNDIWTLPPDAPQQHPIVNGHHVQPRPSDFNHPEFTPSQTKAVDDLYLQIQQMRAGEAAEAIRVLRAGGD